VPKYVDINDPEEMIGRWIEFGPKIMIGEEGTSVHPFRGYVARSQYTNGLFLLNVVRTVSLDPSYSIDGPKLVQIRYDHNYDYPARFLAEDPDLGEVSQGDLSFMANAALLVKDIEWLKEISKKMNNLKMKGEPA
jgi:hypothetical protein